MHRAEMTGAQCRDGLSFPTPVSLVDGHGRLVLKTSCELRGAALPKLSPASKAGVGADLEKTWRRSRRELELEEKSPEGLGGGVQAGAAGGGGVGRSI